jgi:hypothetical protein
MSKKQERNKWGKRRKYLLKFGFMQMVSRLRANLAVCGFAFALTPQIITFLQVANPMLTGWPCGGS